MSELEVDSQPQLQPQGNYFLKDCTIIIEIYRKPNHSSTEKEAEGNIDRSGL